MINATGSIQYRMNGDELSSATRAAIDRTCISLEEQIGRKAGNRDYQFFAFNTMFRADRTHEPNSYDKRFLDAAFQLAQTAPTGNPRQSIIILSEYTKSSPPPATGLEALRRGLKLMLVALWHQDALLIPTVFHAGPSFDIDKFTNPLLDWVREIDPNESPSNQRLYRFAHRIIWASSWRKPEDVTLFEIARLVRARVLHHSGVSTEPIASSAGLPLGLLAGRLHQAFPDRVPYTATDLAHYSLWSQGHSIAQVAFEDFLIKRLEPKAAAPAKPPPKPDLKPLSTSASPEEAHEVILRNFKALKKHRRSLDWHDGNVPTYPGREHIDCSAVSRAWIECFNAYLRHRELVQGFRTNTESQAALNILADYVYFYLPWWKELFPAAKVEIPLTPRDFTRSYFVARHNAVPLHELPATLIDLIRLRRPSNASAKPVVHQLMSFFEFVGTHFADNELIAGPNFKSPLNATFDAPRIQTKNKTTKEVIPKHIYGHLLFYCYAIEQFGVHLEKMAKNGSLSKKRHDLGHAWTLNTEAFGYVPSVQYRGESYPLLEVPNVFTWAEREIRHPADGCPRQVYMPHLSSLRMLITSLETGLRVQSVQWLDRSTWRRFQTGVPPDSYTFPLLVNTDKTKTDSWHTYMVYRVQHLLQREEAFQAQFNDADAFGPVDYEGLAASPFDPIRPLFRSTNSPFPISDSHYDKCWRRLMVSFESFYREATGERHVRMFKLQPRLAEDGTAQVVTDKRAVDPPYCPISILAIHTPHACRATFATNRKGVLELSDTAELLGHSSEVVTAHYDKPDEADIRARLHESDLAIIADYAQFVAGTAGQVRPDKPDSALVKSFTRNRAETIKAFRFMPPIALWSTADSRDEAAGLKLLREGPMSRIRFRETHICPVGEECPADILEQLGEPKRCGSCPLAMRCVDHLPAIAAKRHQLLERIRHLHRKRKQLQDRGEPATVLDEVWEAIELEVNELLGWELSEQILERARQAPPSDGSLVLHVQQPEVVKHHLRKVARSSSAAEFVLQRIADSNAYPSMSTPEVQLAASQLKRRLLAGRGLDEMSLDGQGLDDIRDVSALLALMMKSEGISLAQLAARLTAPTTHASLPLGIEVQNGK